MSVDIDLAGQRLLVVGGSSGIGRSTALAAAERGRRHRGGRPQRGEAQGGRHHRGQGHRHRRRRARPRALCRHRRRGGRRDGWPRRAGVLHRGVAAGAARRGDRRHLAGRHRHERHRARARRAGGARPHPRQRRDRLPVVDHGRRWSPRSGVVRREQGRARPHRALVAHGASRQAVRVHGRGRHARHRLRPRLRRRARRRAVPEVAGRERDLPEPHGVRRPRSHHRRVRGDAARAPEAHHPRAHDRPARRP